MKSPADLCQRVGSKATLAGSIVNLGGEYVVGLTATNCATGDSLATEQARASQKAEVLKALDKAASQLRDKLGESLASIQKFDTPLEETTTSSLEALKAYSLGAEGASRKGRHCRAAVLSTRRPARPKFRDGLPCDVRRIQRSRRVRAGPSVRSEG